MDATLEQSFALAFAGRGHEMKSAVTWVQIADAGPDAGETAFACLALSRPVKNPVPHLPCAPPVSLLRRTTW